MKRIHGAPILSILLIAPIAGASTLLVTDVAGTTRYQQIDCIPGLISNRPTIALESVSLTLRDALCLANRIGGKNVIRLPERETIVLNQVDNWWFGPNGLPPIASDIVIEGNGTTVIRSALDDTAPFRFFMIAQQSRTAALRDGTLTLRNLTLRNGLAKGGDSASGGGGAGMGGAMFNFGKLSLDGVAVIGNHAQGGSSLGAHGNPVIRSGGGMGADADTFRAGGFGGWGPFNGWYGGASGIPGYQTDRQSIGGGGAGFAASAGYYYIGGGTGFSGGNCAGGVNLEGNDGGSGGHSLWTGGPGEFGGQFGGGGGAAGLWTLAGGGGGGIGGGGGDSGIDAPTACGAGGGFGGGGGAGGASDSGVGGGGGFGGGGAAAGGAPGWGGFGGGQGGWIYGPASASGGGGAGMGGAIFSLGSLVIENSTFAGNQAEGGSAYGGQGGDGRGGAVYIYDSVAHISFSTFIDNVSKFGFGGMFGSSASGAIELRTQATATTAFLSKNLFAGSTNGRGTTVSDCDLSRRWPTVTSPQLFSDGANAYSEAGSCSTSLSEDRLVSRNEARLSPVGDHGGPTPTAIPMPGSRLIDVVSCATFSGELVSADQRGFPRPWGRRCDIGAVEYDGDTIFIDGLDR
ncbi:choice-of-anchor Q domain-containing protein [Tahibacter sp.]|uniref:choice-of-anchor Q domain-containing protein n=1 Tax=Tahibacter sp. TaxID=2056211 RepID=UPI0028C4CAD1|nr:choice-of-anchor Q domain-containing protein [Tahibacter sp.]